MERRYYIPRILRIVSVDDGHEAKVWDVETDRDPCSFAVRDSDSFVEVAGNKFIIVDVDENRFCIPVLTLLDNAGRKLLDLHC